MFKTIKIDDVSNQCTQTSFTNKECKIRKNYEDANIKTSRVQLETITGLLEISNNFSLCDKHILFLNNKF